MLIFLVLCQVLSQSIQLIDSFQNSWTLYDSQGYNSLFIWENKQCCTPPNLQIIVANETSNYINNLTIDLVGYKYLSASKLRLLRGIQVKLVEVSQDSLIVENECDLDSKAYDQSLNQNGIVGLGFHLLDLTSKTSFVLEFHYYISCEYSEDNISKINYDSSMLILFMIAPLCVWIYSKTFQIKSLKIKLPNPANQSSLLNLFVAQPFVQQYQYVYFQGFNISWVAMVGYFITVSFFQFVMLKKIEDKNNIILISVLALTFIFSWLVFNEFLHFFPKAFRLQTSIIKFIRICDILALALSGTFIYLYLIRHQSWLYSTVIAFVLTGSFARLFKVISLKQVVVFYVLIILYDIILYTAFLNRKKENYQIEVLKYTNYPFLFEIPQFKPEMNKICCWLSVTDLLIPSLSIAYLYRFCKNRNTDSYFVISITGLALGIAIWTVIAINDGIYGKQIAQSFVVLPLIIVSVCFWALRQGDLRVLWYGDFYDNLLIEYFNEDELERQSQEQIQKEISLAENIQKEQIQSLLDFYDKNDEL